MRLDKKLLSEINQENYKSIFNTLIESKTDRLTNEIKLPMGVDGNSFDNIKNNIKQFSTTFCNRAKNGKYIFSPFREIEIPKAPYSKFEFDEAKKKGKIRTLAIATINDTIFQKMMYNAVYDFVESKYDKLNDNIFGYRKGKSVKQAIEKIKQYFNQGYVYGVDGDIEKYFDRIDHQRLQKKINTFFRNDKLIKKYLYRFIKVKRVPVEFKVKATLYQKQKPKTLDRSIGIPQGGVLSGLLANVYLYNFDKYVVFNLGKRYDLKYIRYADDFIILCKDKSIIIDLYKSLKRYFNREKLNLHPIDSSAIDDSLPNENKTKAINLYKKHYIEFLGFRISESYLAVKSDNILKFKKVIKHIIDVGLKEKFSLGEIIHKINVKILGNGIVAGEYFIPCCHCGKSQKPQSWISFFINITDLRQLKLLDRWMRKQVFHFVYSQNSYRIRLQKKYFRKPVLGEWRNYTYNNLISLFKECCYIKKYIKQNKNIEFCDCEHYDPVYIDYL